MIRDLISRLVDREDLTTLEMEGAMTEIMTGQATPTQIGVFITALRLKGETIDEITGAARAMRNRAVILCTDNIGRPLLDTCGTGGDSSNTFNVSTASAFVAAGGGIRVAKHGNRAVSSKCGSADVLEAMGVRLDITSHQVEECIKETGIGFLFAPIFHEAMKYAAAPRQEIGIRTIFNLLGPLTNPAGANIQVLGVYDPSLTEKIAHVLCRLGIDAAFVVCGERKFDEISICGPTKVSHLKNNQVTTFEICPQDYGLDTARPQDIAGGNIRENALIIKNILHGKRGAPRDIVVFNAAAAFVLAGIAKDLKEGIERAKYSIDSGAAIKKLQDLISFTQAC